MKGAPLSKADIAADGTPFILYGELYTTYSEVAYEIQRKTDKEVEPQFYSRVGDVIMPTSGETPEDIATATCVMTPDVILAGDLLIYRTTAVDGRIISYAIKNKVNKQIASVAQGKSVVHVRAEELGKVVINYPSKAEQEKIIAMLALLEKKLVLQKQIIETLKKYKRGLLYTIFSDDNNWDRVRLGDICSIKTGKLDANAMEDNGAYPFFTCAREHYAINTYAFDCDALLISGNGANVGYIHHYCGKFNAYQRTYVLSNFTANIIYIQYYLETRLAERIEAEKKAGNTPYIVLSTLSDMEISLPALAQQNKIAVLMSYCDKHIQNEESHLEYLEILKKSLLRNLFI